jgi:uncharacterized repeat protein (TIGR03803 family)
LATDPSGNLFGITNVGGPTGDGTIFEVPRGGDAATQLASFDRVNGSHPVAGLVSDAAGDLFATASGGGTSNDGTVIEVADGTRSITTLASFAAGDGKPLGGIAVDASGNLFGTTSESGGGNGTVYEIAHGTSAVTTLVSFGSANGNDPQGVVIDHSGNLFGTTANGIATVFELPAVNTANAPAAGALTTLDTFNNNVGLFPEGGLTLDPSGDLFGTTVAGGAGNAGTVFEVAAGSNTVTALASFNGTNGSASRSDVVVDPSGNLFGTTTAGGSANAGVVFELYQPARLAFLQPPGPATAGTAISPAVKVAVQDPAGNTIAADNSAITLTLTGSAGGTFAGGGTTVTATAVNGVATFDNLVINSPGSYSLTAGSGALATAPAPLRVSPPPTVQAIALSDGSTPAGQAQRSQVRELTITFASPATLASSQVTLSLLNGTASPTSLSGVLGTPAAVAGGNGTQWVVPVLAGTAYTDAGGSLNDGIYTLTLSGVSSSGLTSLTFHRLYGDTDGNKTVNALDYSKFKNAFGTSTGSTAYNPDLDFDNNGNINALDYAQFKKRFGTTFTYT